VNNYAIIVAGGTGVRMISETPKQFMLLGGLPVLMHCISAFHRFDTSITIIVALGISEMERWTMLCKEYNFNLHHQLVPGGERRFYSVKNALAKVPDNGLVAIHDGVRPLVNQSTIRNCFSAAAKFGNAVPVISPSDSVRLIDNGHSRHIDRTMIRFVQTPQVFGCRLIKEAYKQDYQSCFTDDASVLENIGCQINQVEGNQENIKITTPTDMLIAEALMKLNSSE